jgi:integrase/recombinase XerD
MVVTENARGISRVIGQFLHARAAENLAAGSLRFYRQKLDNFSRYCHASGLVDVYAVTGDDLRRYLLWLKRDHRPGGVAAFFRAVHALYTWIEDEYEPEDWRNPIAKIKTPRVPEEILDPIPTETVRALLATCNNGYFGRRDRAIILLLEDTGLRAAELLALDVDAVDLALSVLYVEQGKGGYPRAVDFGSQTKRALRAYLRVRPDVDDTALFLNYYRERLQYEGLRAVIIRRAERAGVDPATLHAFRRRHVLDLHRAGESELTIQRRIGHRDGKTIHRYIKLSREDMRQAAARTHKKPRR